MDSTLMALLAAALGGVGGASVSEVRNHYKIQKIVAAHDQVVEEFNKREDEDEKTKNLCILLAQSFPTSESVRQLGDSLERIQNGADALARIDKYRRSISANSLHVLVSHINQQNAQKKNS